MVASLSRVMSAVAGARAPRPRPPPRERWPRYEEHRDLITLGAYQPGADPAIDDAVARINAIDPFLHQRTDENSSYDETLAELIRLSR